MIVKQPNVQNVTHELTQEVLKKYLTEIQNRFKVYAGEYIKPVSLFHEVSLSVIKTSEPITVEENLYLWAFLEIVYEAYGFRIEFMQHNNCFHPTLEEWYNCKYTTTQEVVCILQEVIDKYA